jgi:hypothetical protein
MRLRKPEAKRNAQYHRVRERPFGFKLYFVNKPKVNQNKFQQPFPHEMLNVFQPYFN